MNITDSNNLIINGTFDSNDLNGWDVAGISSTSPTAYNGHASLPSGGSISQTVDITPGGTYALSYSMGLEYSATGEVNVISNPSGTTLFKDSATGTQSSIALTLTEPADTSLTIKFECHIGGEVDVDNVSLVALEQGFVIGGDFSDPTIPGWVQTGTSSGTMPSVTDGHLKLPAGTSVYQDIVVEGDKQLAITSSMSLSDGAAGKFTIQSRASYTSNEVTTLYTSSTALAGEPVYCFPPEGDIIVRLTYTCSSGEVDVDDVVMGYASTTLISEVQTGDHAPWISPGTSGTITFTIQDNAPADAGARIHFTAPSGTTLVNASIPDLGTNYYTFTASDDALSGNLTLTTGMKTWGSCELTLAVDADTAAGASLSDGVAKYFTADDRQMGDASTISVIAATVTITEQQTDGHTPWIFPGTSGTVTFSIVADSPDGKGSYLYFTAPKYTASAYTPRGATTTNPNAIITGVTFSDPALEGQYTFTSENGGVNARVTLNTDNVFWSDCIVTLAVDSEVTPFVSLDNGKVQYLRSDGQQVGDTAPITILAASGNHWDNVSSVESCFIGMQSDDTTKVTKGTLFMNGLNDADNVFNAHSIPVFVGITFKRFNDDFDGPTGDEVQTALSLVGLASDGQTLIDISDSLVLTSNTDYRNAYYKATTSSPEPKASAQSGGYEHELNLGAWCPKLYNDTLPGNINVYIHLEAPLSSGTYKYTSNGETPANLGVNFLAQKKYQYSETAGSSVYILVNKEPASDGITFSHSGEVRRVGAITEMSIYRIFIDPTPDQSKYVFKLNWLMKVNFSFPPVDSNYTGWGSNIYSAYIRGMNPPGKPQWSAYGQHILLPSGSHLGPDDLTESRNVKSDDLIGPVGTHERYGWACSGSLLGTANGVTINPGEMAFAAFSVGFESSSDGVEWNENNSKDSNGDSRIYLIDNFGNNIYLTPVFGAEIDVTSMSIVVEDK